MCGVGFVLCVVVVVCVFVVVVVVVVSHRHNLGGLQVAGHCHRWK